MVYELMMVLPEVGLVIVAAIPAGGAHVSLAERPRFALARRKRLSNCAPAAH